MTGVFTGTSGSHAHRDETSVATLIKSSRKVLPLVSPCKRGRLSINEKGIESSVLRMGNGSGCGVLIPGSEIRSHQCRQECCEQHLNNVRLHASGEVSVVTCLVVFTLEYWKIRRKIHTVMKTYPYPGLPGSPRPA